MPVCNCVHPTQATIGKITTFQRAAPLTQAFLNLGGWNLSLLKSRLRLTLKISYARCLGLSSAILALFTLKMCVTARNHEQFTKTLYFGGLRSFQVMELDIPKKLVTSACYNKQHVCAYLQLFSRWACR